MKPSWENAPDWANYLARDKDGAFSWFEKRPILKTVEDNYILPWWECLEGKRILVEDFEVNWKDSLEERPKC